MENSAAGSEKIGGFRTFEDVAWSDRYLAATLFPRLLFHNNLEGVRRFVELVEEKATTERDPFGDCGPKGATNYDFQDIEVIAEFRLARDLKFAGPNPDADDEPHEERKAKKAAPDMLAAADVVIVAGAELVACECRFFDGFDDAELDGPASAESRRVRRLFLDRLDDADKAPLRAYRRVLIAPSVPTNAIDADVVLTWADIRDLAETLMGSRHYATERLRRAVERFEDDDGRDIRPRAEERPFPEMRDQRRELETTAEAGGADDSDALLKTNRSAEFRPRMKILARLRRISVWGPGLLVMLADTDAGNVVTGAQAGAQWGYRLLPLLLLLIPMLYMVQELTVRLGIYTGRGHGELIRERFGAGWAWLSTAGLAVATIGSLVTEFIGVAGIGELYGLSRSFTLPIATVALLAVVATGSYRRVERTAIIIGLFELAFFAVAWDSHPNLETLAKDAIDLPLHNREFTYLAAAIIGAVFNPWMIFYQQSATAEKKLRPDDLSAARWDTAVGTVLTQCLSGAVLVAAAATLRSGAGVAELGSVGEISNALSPLLGEDAGRLIFSIGVLGASLVAAIVCSLALTWGVGEVTRYRHSLEYQPFRAKWFYAVYAVCVIGAAALVWVAPNLVWLVIAAQVLNAFLLPLVIGFLVALAAKALPEPVRLRGVYLWVLIGVSALVVAVGLFGGIAGLL